MKFVAVVSLALMVVASAVRAEETSPGKLNAAHERRAAHSHDSIPLDRVSSGALRLLDRGGDLVQPASAPAPASESPSSPAGDPAIMAGLDPRIGSNTRLGNDPSQLPSNLRAQAEPHIARDPTTADVLLATFQEGRYTNGGAADCGYAVSHDGGLSWSRALIPGLTPVVGGPYYRATDPVAGVDLNGIMYLNTLVLLDSTLNTSALVVSRSTNGGASFDSPIEAMRSPNSSTLLDKNWMAINTFASTPTAGRIILTLTRFAAGWNPISCTLSDDGGKTWTPNAFITPTNYSAQASQPVFLPDGRLVVVYWHFSPDRLEMVLSTNGGDNFGSPHQITTVTAYDAPGIRDGTFVPSAASDRTSGQIFVTYQAISQSQPSILFTKSADGGATWSTPRRISDNPGNAPVFNPAVAVSPDGAVVAVAFYDGRMNGGNTNLVDLFLAQSFDSGNTWEPNLRITGASSDVRLAPLTPTGYMVGDYLGVAPSIGTNVPSVPVWVDTRTGNPDPFVARIGMARQVTFPSWRAARFSLSQISDPSIGAAGADPDSDQVVNLFEYVLALNPRLSDRPAFSGSFSGTGQSAAYTVSYERLTGASDVNYSWSSSTNLSSWKPASPSNVVITPNSGRITEIVTSGFSPATNAHQFYRLGISLSN